MALKRHYKCLDHVTVAFAALAAGDGDLAEKHLQEALADEDELREALEDVNESQEEMLEAASQDETDEGDDEGDEGEEDGDEEVATLSHAARVRANISSI